tara:strand:+ start:152 stop:256 length:105 start_codon:yes stop_codon:yes gene_type:complete
VAVVVHTITQVVVELEELEIHLPLVLLKEILAEV